MNFSAYVVHSLSMSASVTSSFNMLYLCAAGLIFGEFGTCLLIHFELCFPSEFIRQLLSSRAWDPVFAHCFSELCFTAERWVFWGSHFQSSLDAACWTQGLHLLSSFPVKISVSRSVIWQTAASALRGTVYKWRKVICWHGHFAVYCILQPERAVSYHTV